MCIIMKNCWDPEGRAKGEGKDLSFLQVVVSDCLMRGLDIWVLGGGRGGLIWSDASMGTS